MLVHEHNLSFRLNSAPFCSKQRFRTFTTRSGTIVIATELAESENPGLTLEECLPQAIKAWLDLSLPVGQPFEFWTHFNSRSFAVQGGIPRVGDPSFSRVNFEYDGENVSVIGREIILLDEAAKRLELAYVEVLAL